MRRKPVAVIDYRSSQGIANIRRMLERMEKEGKVNPGNWRKKAADFRSMIVFDDGSCLLHVLTAASMIKSMKKGFLIRGVQQ